MKPSQPYLTIVVTARNDNHGGDFLRRMQLFVSNLLTQANQMTFSLELLVVEWNSIPDQPSLSQQLAWPTDNKHCMIRFIEVLPHYHHQFSQADKIPLFQMIAKNVGIRRAKGQFVLTTNVDLLFSPELIRFFADQSLQIGKIYRIDRYDVSADVPIEASIAEQLDYCRRNVLRIHSNKRLVDYQQKRAQHYLQLDTLKRLWVLLCYTERPSSLKEWSHLFYRGHLWVQDRLWSLLPSLHLNAPGDFTLLAKTDWLALRGYPELAVHALHLDSIFCYMAYYAGINEIVLNDPLRIYHLEHQGGSGTDILRLYKQLAQADIPVLTYSEVRAWSLAMKRGQRPIVYNDDDWGLGQADLKETIYSKRDRSFINTPRSQS